MLDLTIITLLAVVQRPVVLDDVESVHLLGEMRLLNQRRSEHADLAHMWQLDVSIERLKSVREERFAEREVEIRQDAVV
jgi:hypothetical protein